MLIFGHRFIPSRSFYHVLDIDSISNTPPSSTICVQFSEENLDIINHASLNNISISISVNSILELIYSASLGASFIIVERNLALDAQKIATEYLYDSKILVHINDENEIEELALHGMDGVILPSAIIKINS
ncbi:hypothetical protein JHD48_00810 [Sulfurimonas sp. SAG-AH-194-I05]|nr:hypothetical protein [Sulfurimonas sp. SAG-AH-194-I05]MDF1874268.1 hypothetical protein [Sulfurimonas sp. SAG-AH-194-I05]